MIRYLEHSEIDFIRWDSCVDNCAVGLPYGFAWYLDAVCEKWAGLVLGDYEAVMPLPYKHKLGLRYIYQPFFTQQLGVFGQGDVGRFIDAIPARFMFVHTLFNYTCKTSGDIFVPQTNLLVSLKNENIERSFSQNCIRNIRKSKKYNLYIEKCDPNELINVFRATKGKFVQHLKEKNYQTLSLLLQKMNDRSMIESLGVYTADHNLLGGVVLLQFKQRLIFFFSALTEEGKSNAAMFHLISEIIRMKKNVFDILDFEGSNDEKLSRFYRGFGAEEQNYSSYKRNNLPRPLRVLKN